MTNKHYKLLSMGEGFGVGSCVDVARLHSFQPNNATCQVINKSNDPELARLKEHDPRPPSYMATSLSDTPTVRIVDRNSIILMRGLSVVQEASP